MSYFSWIPFSFTLPTLSFPTLSIPSSIQRRFISFLLQRALGHLVKPGQLDTKQIDAQIGNGLIEIRDVELDDQAVNALIADLPLRLQSGSIGRITTRIPWPNIFTSPFTLSISSLDLSFVLSPLTNIPPSPPLPHDILDVSQSVASVAETFLHEELSTQDHEVLRESIVLSHPPTLHLHHPPDLRMPGGSLDPFLEDPSLDEEDEKEIDLEGVSILATAVERLLARFSFVASDTCVRITHERKVEVLLSIPEISYATEVPPSDDSSETPTLSVIRTVKITGLSVALTDLTPSAPRTPHQRSSSRSSSSYGSSPQSEDEGEIPQEMSQSIATLPASSMYHSAASSFLAGSPEQSRRLSQPIIPEEESKRTEDAILAFASEPIMIRLVTSRPLPSTSSPDTAPPPSTEQQPKSSPKISLAVNLGIFSCALQAWHIKALVATTNAVLPLSPSPQSHSTPQRPPLQPQIERFEASLTLRSAILLLLLTPPPSEDENPLDAFFQRPLIPQIGTNHLRIQLDNLIASTTKSSVTEVDASIGDISIFSISPSASSGAWTSLPILIVDPNLLSVNTNSSETFPIIDLTLWKPRSGEIKSSSWRTRSPQSIGKRKTTASPSALTIRMSPGSTMSTPHIHVHVIPLHIFVDLKIIAGLLPFIQAISTVDDDDRETVYADSPPSTPRASFSSVHQRPSSSSSVVIQFALVRVELVCPPPPPLSSSASARSGACVLDVHNICVISGANPPPAHAHFTEPRDAGLPKLAEIEMGRVLVAFGRIPSLKASTFLTIGSLSSPEQLFGTGFSDPPLNPKIIIRSTSVECTLPTIQISLDKSTIDGLQLFADDIVQWAERALSEPKKEGGSGRTTLIGSRFFVKGSSSVSAASSIRTKRGSVGSEFAFSLHVAQASVRLWVPRGLDADVVVRPLDIKVWDVDVLAEVKPEGKNETVVHLSVMDAVVTDVSLNGDSVALLSLTVPRQVSRGSHPLVSLRLASVAISDSIAKESRIKLTVSGFTHSIVSDFSWLSDIARFAKAPPGAFESVIPSERTIISLNVIEGSIRVQPPGHKGAMALAVGELDLQTSIVGSSPNTTFHITVGALSMLLVDDVVRAAESVLSSGHGSSISAVEHWKRAGFAPLAEIRDTDVMIYQASRPDTRVEVNGIKLKLQACADTIGALTNFFAACSAFAPQNESTIPKAEEPRVSSIPIRSRRRDTFTNIDEHAFRRAPELGPAGDMIDDDLPTNPDYLGESFGAAAGLQELSDEEFQDLDEPEEVEGSYYEDRRTPTPSSAGPTDNISGATVRMLDPRGIHFEENYFDHLPPQDENQAPEPDVVVTSVRIRDCQVNILLHDGYDWFSTRHAIEEQVRAVRRRLEKIRRLLANGQVPEETVEEASATLFNSVYIGLPSNADEMEPGALIAAIDEELNDDFETTSQSSWQSLHARPNQPSQPKSQGTHIRGRKLTRSKSPRVEFSFSGLSTEIDQLLASEPLSLRVLVCVRDFEILDHIRTSTWRTFLTELKTDSRGNVRETGSNMVRAEFKLVRPVPGLPAEEARVRAKFLPLRLHVDQDALDFLKKFFAFSNPQPPPPSSAPPSNEIYFQHAEVFPVEIKLDYKPKRVDYRALRDGKTIELMNFFHFDGAEMTLRHITLSGITGWPKLFDLLNDLWTPDVKANQLADIISSIGPIRSIVNVGSGVADLVLLPIAQYKKDKRLVRGVQKGTTSFLKTTAMEAIQIGARLATGTQVILEHAEHVLGGDFKDTMTLEARSPPSPSYMASRGPGASDNHDSDEGSDSGDPISKYAEQPVNVMEGIHSASRSIRRNLNSAAQTILAVPMEVYENSGNEGAMRSVIRAVPIAVLRPMIGASEALSKTLFGLSNTLDPSIRRQNEDKYKQR